MDSDAPAPSRHGPSRVDRCFDAMLADPGAQLRPPSSVGALRAAFESWFGVARGPVVHAVEPVRIDLPSHSLAARLYRPYAGTGLALILFFHGGGFVVGSLDTHDAMCRAIAAGSGAAVLSVDYRRAPECPFPGPVEDCCGALAWAMDHAAGLGLDPLRIALAGDSAGGNLALATALAARERRMPAFFSLRGLGLIYPILDPDSVSDSAHRFADGYVLTRRMIEWFWACYLGSRPGAADPHVPAFRGAGPPPALAAPMAADLAGLPATSILTAEFDPLRDEGETLAARMRAAGVPVRLRRYEGMLHGFASLPHVTPSASAALADLASEIAATLAPPAPH
jgi:acetyl esterase